MREREESQSFLPLNIGQMLSVVGALLLKLFVFRLECVLDFGSCRHDILLVFKHVLSPLFGLLQIV